MVDTNLCTFEIGRKEKEKKQNKNRTEASNFKRTLEFSLIYFFVANNGSLSYNALGLWGI